MEEVPIGGQEFQLDAPGVTLRDVANGGTQTAANLAAAYRAARGNPSAIAKLSPGAAEVYGVAKGVGAYLGADKLLDRETWARLFGSK